MFKLGDVVIAKGKSNPSQGDYKYITHIHEDNGSQTWLHISGLGGNYGALPADMEKKPANIDTWCDRNEYNDPD